MNEKEAREALHLVYERQAHRKGQDYDPAAAQHLVDVQIANILKRGDGTWKNETAKAYLHEHQNLFRELGSDE